jgi:hypothetical protein
MQLTIAPSDQDIFLALWTVLTGILPAGDAVFTGAISGATLTVSRVDEGTIGLGDDVLGTNVAPGTVIAQFLTGAGGVGTYLVSPDQGSVAISSGPMSTGVAVLQAQVDRVPEPKAEDFMTMTILRLPRLSTNLESFADVTFTGSIAAGVLTASAPVRGTLRRGANVFGATVAAGTKINALLTGSGAAGTYSVAPAQTAASQVMAAGGKTVTQSSQCTIQLDVHGPGSAQWAQIISTMFRSETIVEAFAAVNPAIAPLYADDPRQMAFHNAEQQYENRYVVEVNLQVNQTVVASQQFASSLELDVVDVETPADTWPNAVITAP